VTAGDLAEKIAKISGHREIASFVELRAEAA